jgi:DNA-binding NtrC family response regulator
MMIESKLAMPPQILILDTDPFTRQSLLRRLAGEHFHVVEAGDVPEAEREISAGSIEVILIDLRGLDNKALHLLERITVLSPHTRTILLTSRDTIALAIQGMKMGAFDDLMTPLDMSSLVTRVRQAVESSQTSRNRLRFAPHPSNCMRKFIESAGLQNATMYCGLLPVS